MMPAVYSGRSVIGKVARIDVKHHSHRWCLGFVCLFEMLSGAGAADLCSVPLVAADKV